MQQATLRKNNYRKILDYSIMLHMSYNISMSKDKKKQSAATCQKSLLAKKNRSNAKVRGINRDNLKWNQYF